MNKHEIRNAALDGKVTLGHLRRALANTTHTSWERSKVNKGLTKEQALDILRRAVDADSRDNNTVMNNRRDVLVATNVLRECGIVSLL